VLIYAINLLLSWIIAKFLFIAMRKIVVLPLEPLITNTDCGSAQSISISRDVYRKLSTPPP